MELREPLCRMLWGTVWEAWKASGAHRPRGGATRTRGLTKSTQQPETDGVKKP